MAISYPGISYLRGYDKGDPFGKFVEGYGFGKGLKDEAEAPDAFMAWLDSLGGAQTQRQVSPIDQLVTGSHAAAESAADPMLTAYFANTRMRESGGNDTAQNPNSTARGRYQVLEGTWNDYMNRYPQLGLTPDGRDDPAQQERFIRQFTADNARALRGAGVPVNPGSLYAAHFLGAGAASKVLTGDPNSPVSAYVDPGVIEANPQLANMTVAEFQEWAAGGGRNNAGGYQPPMVAPSQPAGMPDRETMRRLFANPVTRPIAVELAKSAIEGRTAKPVVVNDRLVDPYTGRIVGDFSDAAMGDRPDLSLNQVWGLDENGQPVLGQMSDDGRFVPTQLPPGVTPMDPRTLAGERAFGTESGKRAADRIDQLPGLLAKSDNMLTTIDGILNDPAFDTSTGWLAWMQQVPGTDQYRFGQRALQLQGQAFLQAFESLKGGGQITEIEGVKATQAIGRLSTAQKPEDYRAALEELKGIIEAAKQRAMAQVGNGAPAPGAVDNDPLGIR